MKHFARELRRTARVVRRGVADRLSGTSRRMVAPVASSPTTTRLPVVVLTVRQPIFETGSAAAKRHNLGRALERMNGLLLKPGEVLGFWHLVGKPTRRNGYLPGRSLLGGKLVLDTGGGLCQLAGLIYHASLMAGLRILERHPHSVDIYTDETRYTPLGSDATVAYGFKDLRVENALDAEVQFCFQLKEQRISGEIRSTRALPVHQLEFVPVNRSPTETIVETRRRQSAESNYTVIETSRYARPADR